MKIGTWILTISLAATAWAQSPAPKPQPTTKPQTSTQSAAKPAVLPEKSAAAAPKSAAPAVKSERASKAKKHASASSKAAAKPEAAKSATQSANQSATKPADKAGKQAAGKQEPGKQGKEAQASPDKTVAKVTVHKGKRDPFVSPVRERKFAVCTVGGKRCLFIEDLNLVGIIEASNGTVAVVANGRHTYFLREHDPLADGEVMRITGDTITLRQRTTDLFGHQVEREVTRKIGMPAV